MTKIKLCGLSRECDIAAVNELQADYIGFVFAPKSKRRVSIEQAVGLKKILNPGIKVVGVFVNEDIQTVARLLNDGVIDMAQLHGSEDEEYIRQLRNNIDKPVIKAFQINTARDVQAAEKAGSDWVLLDAGSGSGKVFDWDLIQKIKRPYFLAGGLTSQNVALAINKLQPYAIDVSSGIETDGLKDKNKMAALMAAVRKAGKI